MTQTEPGQATILDAFWADLHADRNAVPPSALEPDTAALAAELERTLHPDEPRSRFVSELRDRLLDASAPHMHPNGIAPGLLPLAPSGEATALDTSPHLIGVAGHGSRPGWVGEWAKLVAAVIVFTVVGGLLAIVFRGQAEPEQTTSQGNIAGGAIQDHPGEILVSMMPDGKIGWRLFIVPTDGSAPRRFISPENAFPGSEDSARWSPDGRQVVFVAGDDTSRDIYVVNADGTNIRNLTNSHEWEGGPSWSPDGSQIVFQRQTQLHVMNADGSDVRAITDATVSSLEPFWSPDGSRIVYWVVGEPHDMHGSLYLIDADGSNRTRLSEEIAARNPVWSPNGSRVAYTFGRFGSQVMVAEIATGARDQYLPNLSTNSPSWSPDGRQLAFVAHDPGGSLDGIFITDLDSDETRLLTHLSGEIAWSPDGTQIAVLAPRVDLAGNETGERGLYLVDVDDGEQHLLLEGQMLDFGFAWRPATTADEDAVDDSAYEIVAPMNLHGEGTGFKLYAIRPDCGELRKILLGFAEGDPTNETYPAWSPDGHTLAFSSDRDGDDDIYLWDGSGDPYPITDRPDDASHERGAQWTPDGQAILLFLIPTQHVPRPGAWRIDIGSTEIERIEATGDGLSF